MKTALIEKITAHPNGRKLRICQVNTGAETLQIVCGASNAREGMISILAPIGASLDSGLKIEKATLRGVDSFGMLCSPADLGVSEERGIIDLPPNTELGKPWQEIPKNQLSSTPWFHYRLVESLWLSPDKKRIEVLREQESPSFEKGSLVSQTFFDGQDYIYRHF